MCRIGHTSSKGTVFYFRWSSLVIKTIPSNAVVGINVCEHGIWCNSSVWFIVGESCWVLQSLLYYIIFLNAHQYCLFLRCTVCLCNVVHWFPLITAVRWETLFLEHVLFEKVRRTDTERIERKRGRRNQTELIFSVW